MTVRAAPRRGRARHRAFPYGGMILDAIHGTADLELSGHLPPSKWGLSADELAGLIVATLEK